jgi:hypothetical protein
VDKWLETRECSQVGQFSTNQMFCVIMPQGISVVIAAMLVD